jgi:hypothetical protein
VDLTVLCRTLKLLMSDTRDVQVDGSTADIQQQTVIIPAISTSRLIAKFRGHAVVVKALCYKPEGRGFETR